MQSKALWRLAPAPRIQRWTCHTLTTPRKTPSQARLVARSYEVAHGQRSYAKRTQCRGLSSSASSVPNASTIFALSTASGRSAIAIIRISGPACLTIYRALCPGRLEPKPRQATVRTLFSPGIAPSDASILDRDALILYFQAPKTVTGEDILELHVHGGPAIVQAILRAIPRCTLSSNAAAITYAEPGEFTRRAFQNGKLDLTQVEALGDSLSAMTEQQRRLSIRGSAGQLAKRYEQWRTQLLNARGELEALIDFSEDQHFDESVPDMLASVATQVDTLMAPLQAHVTNAVRGELLRNGIQISLLGVPNAGKSSLLNRIVGREAAIVSQEAGTTRDIVEVGIDLGGYFCRLGDTAGLRTQHAQGSAALSTKIGAIEQEGMRRAKERAAESDVVIVVLDLETVGKEARLRLDHEVCRTTALLTQHKGNVVVVINKTDLIEDSDLLEKAFLDIRDAIPGIEPSNIYPISCLSNGDNGIQAFLNGLGKHFDNLTAAIVPGHGEHLQADHSIWRESLGATTRHRLLLERTISSLQHFLSIAQPGVEDTNKVGSADDDDMDVVVAAEHLRDAADCLAKITGRGEAGDVEEVLGVVFEKFCVGK